ncbi:probable G-protein coupled receptor 139 [Carcharodon carcharias]|uniref:probable G-protein coupled receptor 139 n=1 Tax=Carcharodon carcharias TaxID=13397 RepID=UPI001B7E92E4|nr:probable G-protein coupled receptor 139 [Carcharodon carcharias]
MITVLQIENVYYPVLAAFGVPANLMTIAILSRGNCDLSKCISLYMTAMAAADLLVMIFNVIIYRVISFHFPSSFLSYTAVCKFILSLNPAILDLSVWFTVSFTFDRFVAICCQKFKTKYSTQKTATVVLTIVSVVMYFENIPFWFAYEPERIINNISWGCLSSVVFYSSPAGVAYSWFKSIFVAWLPFCLILLFNCLTIRRIIVASRARRALRGHHRENQSDLEMKNRRKSITLLFGVSGSFLLFWLTAVVSFLTTRLPSTAQTRGDFATPEYIATETGCMLMYLSSCSNTFIYAATQTKFREEIKKVMIIPWTLILTLVKKKEKKKKTFSSPS